MGGGVENSGSISSLELFVSPRDCETGMREPPESWRNTLWRGDVISRAKKDVFK